MKRAFLLTSALAALIFPAQAACASAEDAEESRDEIVVTGAFQRDLRDSSSPVSVLSEEELQRDMRPQLGETLASQAGVSATSFGPNVSRPVLRGFQGERVRVLTDGIGAFDVSNTSADHAVAIDPLLADRVEVLRGPASLRFGSSAIGGVVNVVDNRIPTAMPDKSMTLDLTAGFGSAANERAGGGAASFALSDSIALRVSGSHTRTDDLRIGGAVLSPQLRQLALASADADVRELAAIDGKIPNSGGKTTNATIGLAHINDGGTIGFALTRYESSYGLPIRYDLTPGAEQEAVSIVGEQTRADLRVGLNLPGDWFDSFTLRGGYAEYQHVEQESDGAVGTLFANNGYEARAVLRQAKRGGWQGIRGVQTFFRDFLAVGEEAFVPPNETVQTGLFTLQELEFGPVRIEAGGRIERTTIKSNDIGFDRSFSAKSAAFGAFITAADGLKFGVNLSTTARAPAAEELLADGPHVGTQSYEIGNPNFGIERARGAEFIVRADGKGWSVDLAAYYTRFNGYIYEFETGDILDDLPVFQFAQGDATYKGIEIEAWADLFRIGNAAISGDLVADYVHAEIDDFGPAPRIPPFRLLVGADVAGEKWSMRVEGEFSAKQDRVTGFETTTDSFTRINISGDVQLMESNDVRLSFSANNIFDVEARRHANFMKDFSPLAGRDIRLSVKFRL